MKLPEGDAVTYVSIRTRGVPMKVKEEIMRLINKKKTAIGQTKLYFLDHHFKIEH